LNKISENYRKDVWPNLIFNLKKDKDKSIPENILFITDGFYSKKHKICLHYYLNPDLLKNITGENSFVTIDFESNYKDENDISHNFKTIINYTYKCINKLHLKKQIKNIKSEYFIIPNRVDPYCDVVERKTGFFINSIDDNHFFTKVKNDYGKCFFNINYKKLKKEINSLRKQNLDEKNKIRLLINNETAKITKWEKVVDKMNLDVQNSIHSVVYRFENKVFSAKILANTGRLYTTVASAHKKMLKYLLVDDKELIGLDLANSQVMILLNLFVKPKKLLKSIQNTKYEMLKTYMDAFCNTEIDTDTATELLSEIINEKTDIYKELGKENNRTRESMKAFIFKYLFTEPQYEKTNRINYPDNYAGLFLNLSNLKKKFKEVFGSAKKHISPFLSLVESHIFIEQIYPLFIKENIWALTKHDSILVQKTYNEKEEAKRIIEKVFNKIDFKGIIKEEDYNEIQTGYIPSVIGPSEFV
jgi:hypothetical protein